MPDPSFDSISDENINDNCDAASLDLKMTSTVNEVLKSSKPLKKSPLDVTVAPFDEEAINKSIKLPTISLPAVDPSGTRLNTSDINAILRAVQVECTSIIGTTLQTHLDTLREYTKQQLNTTLQAFQTQLLHTQEKFEFDKKSNAKKAKITIEDNFEYEFEYMDICEDATEDDAMVMFIIKSEDFLLNFKKPTNVSLSYFSIKHDAVLQIENAIIPTPVVKPSTYEVKFLFIAKT